MTRSALTVRHGERSGCRQVQASVAALPVGRVQVWQLGDYEAGCVALT